MLKTLSPEVKPKVSDAKNEIDRLKKSRQTDAVTKESIKTIDYGFPYKSVSTWKSVRIFTDIIAISTSVFVSLLLTLFLGSLLDTPAGDVELLITSNSIITNILVPSVTLILLCIFWGHYSGSKSFWPETIDIIKAVIYAGALVFAYSFLFKTHSSRLWMFLLTATLVFTVPSYRYLLRAYLRKRNLWDKPLVLIGELKQIQKIESTFSEKHISGYQIAAKIVISYKAGQQDIAEKQTIIENQLKEILVKYPESGVLLAFPDNSYMSGLPQLVSCLARNAKRTMIASHLWGLPQAHAEVFSPPTSDFVYLNLTNRYKQRSSVMLKRCFDIVASIVFILLLAPLMFVVSIAVLLEDGIPFYKSERLGFGGKKFFCYKFRSMRMDGEKLLTDYLSKNPAAKEEWQTTFKLKNDPRITNMGSFLRRTSLDELPQLFNVLRGEMSLVGPRPLLTDEIEAYGPDFEEYTEVTPGLTGLWQVSGRNNTSYKRRIELNQWYQRNWSFWLDITIILKTIPSVLKTNGAY